MPETARSKANVGGLVRFTVLIALAGAAASLAPAQPVMGQGHEYNERVCNNVRNNAERENWPSPAIDLAVLEAEYTPTEGGAGQPVWKLERVCDGDFLRARSLVADIAQSVLQPIEGEPARFTDFYQTRWDFTLSDDGAVEKLEITSQAGVTSVVYPVRE